MLPPPVGVGPGCWRLAVGAGCADDDVAPLLLGAEPVRGFFLRYGLTITMIGRADQNDPMCPLLRWLEAQQRRARRWWWRCRCSKCEWRIELVACLSMLAPPPSKTSTRCATRKIRGKIGPISKLIKQIIWPMRGVEVGQDLAFLRGQCNSNANSTLKSFSGQEPLSLVRLN